jgi:hypothetical protein
MSMHRGAEILGSIASAGYTSSKPTTITNPNIAAPPNTPLAAVQATATSGGETLTSGYTLVVTAGNSNTDTFTCGQTTSGRYIVADSGSNIISYPT